MKSNSISSLYTEVQSFSFRLRLAGKNIIAILRESLASFQNTHASQAAASIAYYALFSLFPLVLVLVVGGSFFLQRTVVQEQLISWIGQIVPGSVDLINQNIQQVLNLRGTFGFIAVITLLWSSSGVFNTIVQNINRAFPEAPRRSYVSNRMIALVMVGGLIGISFIALVMKTLVRLLPEHIPLLGLTGWQTSSLWSWFIIVSPPILNFLIFWVLYWWIPNIGVSSRASSVAALITSLIQRLFSLGFSWYLGSGLERYELVYGSLSSIVVLLFYIYLTSWIILWGAHLTAAISRREKLATLAELPG
jgi:membrane protein